MNNIKTSKAEEINNWLSRYKYATKHMNKERYRFFLYLILNEFNKSIIFKKHLKLIFLHLNKMKLSKIMINFYRFIYIYENLNRIRIDNLILYYKILFDFKY